MTVDQQVVFFLIRAALGLFSQPLLKLHLFGISLEPVDADFQREANGHIVIQNGTETRAVDI